MWAPPTFSQLVLVDDEGELLSSGSPSGSLPNIYERQQNWALVEGSKYGAAAVKLGEAGGEGGR